MEFDGITFLYNYRFLKKLENRFNLQFTGIKFKLLDPYSGKDRFLSFKGPDDIAAQYPCLKSPLGGGCRVDCWTGSFSVLYNVYLENRNYDFYNRFKILNIPAEPLIKPSFDYDRIRGEDNRQRSGRFRSRLLDIFSTYSGNIDTVVNDQIDLYIENCYYIDGYINKLERE